jgi:hypothetical protein
MSSPADQPQRSVNCGLGSQGPQVRIHHHQPATRRSIEAGFQLCFGLPHGWLGPLAFLNLRRELGVRWPSAGNVR